MSRLSRGPSHFIGEWFGHRIYPTVVSSRESLADQRDMRCPFLTKAKAADTPCIKPPNARGVCTVTSRPTGQGLEDPENPSNPVNAPTSRDWLVCPYRALDPLILESCVGLLFGFDRGTAAYVIPAVRLGRNGPEDASAEKAVASVRRDVSNRLRRGERVFIYFDEKLGGELSMPGTANSPEFSFDVTVFELILKADRSVHVDRFGIVEIQTMDFHGTYQHAVRNLTDALRLHGKGFAQAIHDNQAWLSERMKGPNIANVFKRTFYQMMFKFQLAQHPVCAGCVLAIPESVWASWAPHLANPNPVEHGDGTWDLFAPGAGRPSAVPAWVFVFGLDSSARSTPSPVQVRKVIATDAAAISHHALVAAPSNSLASIASPRGMLYLAKARIKVLWPELAATISIDVPPAPRMQEVPPSAGTSDP